MSYRLSRTIAPHRLLYKSLNGLKAFDITRIVEGKLCNSCYDELTDLELIYETSMCLSEFVDAALDFEPFYICRQCARRDVTDNPAFVAFDGASEHLPEAIANIISGYCVAK